MAKSEYLIPPAYPCHLLFSHGWCFILHSHNTLNFIFDVFEFTVWKLESKTNIVEVLFTNLLICWCDSFWLQNLLKVFIGRFCKYYITLFNSKHVIYFLYIVCAFRHKLNKRLVFHIDWINGSFSARGTV